MKGNFSFWTHLSYLVHGQSSATSAPAQDITLPTKRWVPDVLMCCVAPVTRCWPECPARTTRRAACDHRIFEKIASWNLLAQTDSPTFAVRRFDSLKDQSWKPRDELSPGPLQNCLLRKLAFSLLIHFQNFIESDHQVTISDGIPKNLTSWNNFA